MAPEKVSIGDRDYYITRLDPFTALQVFGDLQKEVLPAIGKLAGDGGEADIPGALALLSKSMDGKALKSWFDRLCDKEHVAVDIDGDTKPLTQAVAEIVFTDFGEMLELLARVVEVNFKGPLTRWLTRTGLGQNLSGIVKLGASPKS